jgi:hypothetical protein
MRNFHSSRKVVCIFRAAMSLIYIKFLKHNYLHWCRFTQLLAQIQVECYTDGTVLEVGYDFAVLL